MTTYDTATSRPGRDGEPRADAAAPRLVSALAPIGAFASAVLRRISVTDELQFVVHCVLLLMLMTIARPLFSTPVPVPISKTSSCVGSGLSTGTM